jgi:2-desacetyl-2-hydroxyethyl bacteriochlorophyllide A dehydrogenase
MRAVTSRDRRVDVVQIDEPVIRTAEHVVIEVTSAGICASDLHLVELGATGVVLGHEFGGFTPDGTLVAVRPTGACGHCHSCTTSRPQLCRDATGRMYGTALDGGLAERVLVERERLVPLAEGVDPRAAALVEPIAVAVHGVDRANVTVGDRVLVIGGGSIGLFTTAVLRDRGADVDLIARHPHQGDVARSLGASLDIAHDYDVVIDAVSTQSSTDEAVKRCRAGATLVELGMFWQPVSFGIPMLLKEITVVPSIFYAHDHDHDDMAAAADLLARQHELGEILVTHRYRLDEAVTAFATAADRASGAIKVHLHP